MTAYSKPYSEYTFREKMALKGRERARDIFWKHHDRERYTCPSCGCDYEGAGRRWEVHHIDGDWLNNHIFNLVAVCHSCHVVGHRWSRAFDGLADWKESFLDLGEEDYQLIDDLTASQPVRADGSGGDE